ncbi:hypothetical protein HDU67_001353 [Dinochytrium kinnereticum]|nr:hypothetical protein HDU67_001353 [Dinochytrium kinnereticum]
MQNDLNGSSSPFGSLSLPPPLMPPSTTPGTPTMGASTSRRHGGIPYDPQRPRLQQGEHPFDLFAVEVWQQIIDLLDPNAAFTLRCVSTAFRFILREELLDVLLKREPLASLRTFAAENILLKAPSPSLGPSASPSLRGSITSITSPILSGSMPNLTLDSPSLPQPSPTLPPTPYPTLLRLHHHIDPYLDQTLGPEPDRYTDSFTLSVHYDPTLTGLAMAERRDEWFRKGGGSRGRSLAREHWEWERLREAIGRELRGLIARVWAIVGRTFPFSKTENLAWRERRRAKLVVKGKESLGDALRVSDACGLSLSSSSSSATLIGVSTSRAKALRGVRDPSIEGEDDGDPGVCEWGRPNESICDTPDMFHLELNHSSFQRPSTDFHQHHHRRRRNSRNTPCSRRAPPPNLTHLFDTILTPQDIATSSHHTFDKSSVEGLLECLRVFARGDEWGDGRLGLMFPETMGSAGRKRVHEVAGGLGVGTRSFGSGGGRFVVAFKGV